jgi:cytochrome oxidase Cu insertion factor (SCO1/SenC/PrrC family)
MFRSAMSRALRLILPAILVVLALAGATLWLTGLPGLSPAGRGGAVGITLPAGTAIGGGFHLIDEHGTPVSPEDYRGRWMLVYFGYTFCPDVCPTTLQTIATALDKLGKGEAEKIAPLFITIDPERDTPPVLARYVGQFDPRIIGLTGTPAAIADAARAYRVYYAKETPKDGSPYTMDHSSFIYLMDPEGRLAALFGPQTTADELAAGIKQKLGQDK